MGRPQTKQKKIEYNMNSLQVENDPWTSSKGHQVPAVLTATLQMYAKTGTHPGSIVRSILSCEPLITTLEVMGELPKRVGLLTIEDLVAVVEYITAEMPRQCWGTAETVHKWIDHGGHSGLDRVIARENLPPAKSKAFTEGHRAARGIDEDS